MEEYLNFTTFLFTDAKMGGRGGLWGTSIIEAAPFDLVSADQKSPRVVWSLVSVRPTPANRNFRSCAAALHASFRWGKPTGAVQRFLACSCRMGVPSGENRRRGGGRWSRLGSAPGGCNRLAHAPISRRKCTLPDASPATMTAPSSDTAHVRREPSPLKEAMICPFSTSQTLSVRSHDADIARLPSGVTATALIRPV